MFFNQQSKGIFESEDILASSHIFKGPFDGKNLVLRVRIRFRLGLGIKL